MKKVSVIVPVYNTEKYLRRCLDSLVMQTLDDIEIIIIEDKSPDNANEILKEYEKKYKDKLKVFHNKTNKGIGYNRNFGIEKSNGKYIGFVDSDDFVNETMFEKMYNKAEKENLDLVLCNFYKNLEKQNGSLESLVPEFIIPDFKNTTLKDYPDLILKVNLAPWNKLYRRNLFTIDVRFPEDLKYEDAIVVIKTMARAEKIGIVDEKLNYYLVRNKSETTIMDKKVYDILTITKMILEELKSHDYYNDIKEYVEAMTIRNLFRYTLQQKYQKDSVIRNDFIDKVFDYLNSEFPNWKNNKIWKQRSFLKRIVESNKLLTKLYCNINAHIIHGIMK